MGERKGQNKYYPPDFDYKKHKSLDNYHGSHPLRERAKKLGQGILVIRNSSSLREVLGSGKFRGQVLVQGKFNFESAREALLDKLLSSLSGRFADVTEGILNASTIVNLKTWPEESEMEDFGDDHVRTIVTQFGPILEGAGVSKDDAEVEWTQLKTLLYSRFEMPYNIWCDGCGNHIGMGVRYNAEKSKIGNYYTTPIYKFRMKCHLCPNYIEIKTDPAAHDYVIISGARRKEQRWDPKENEQIVPEDRATHKKIELDAMYRLEHGTEDKAKLKAAVPGVAQIAELQATKKDDYLLNKLARQKFRDEKKSMSTVSDQNAALLSKSTLNIELVDEHKDDVKLAKLLKYSTVSSFDERQKQKREEIEGRPLFSQTAENNSSGTTPEAESSVNTKQQLDNIRKRLGLPSTHSQTFNVSMSPSTKKTLSPTTFGIVQMRKTEKDLRNAATHSLKTSTEDEQITQAAAPGADSEHRNNALSALGTNYDSSDSCSSDQ